MDFQIKQSPLSALVLSIPFDYFVAKLYKCVSEDEQISNTVWVAKVKDERKNRIKSK